MLPFLEAHLLTIIGFVLALLLLGRLMRDDVPPGSAAAWLIAIIFVPYIAIPLYLLVGGRKFRRRARRKRDLELADCDFPLDEGQLGPVAGALARLSATIHPCGGNRVEMLDTGVKTYETLMRNIEEAQESIEICVFMITDDPVGRKVRDALAQRARDGIKVRFLVDAGGSFFTKGRFLNPLREAGADVATFLPVLPIRKRWSMNLRNHRKIYLFDRKVAIVGGKNIGQDYMGPKEHPARWSDYAMEVRGPVVHSLIQIFVSDWEFASGEADREALQPCRPEDFPAQGDVILHTISSGPDTPGNPLYEALLTALFQARKRIWIVTPYLIPDLTILNTLRLQAKLGCDVRVIVPLKADIKLTELARRFAMRELHRAGAKVCMYEPSMIHSKILLIDDEVAFTGSPNLDQRSLYLNYEVGVFIYTEEYVKQVEAHYEDLLNHCRPYTRRDSRFRGWFEEMLENLSRLLSPLL